MDPEVVRMAVLQRRPGALEFSVGNSQELPFAAASFDFATSVCSFEHFLDDRRAFSEAARVLRPDGWLFVTVDSLTHPAVTEAFRSRHRVACRVAQYYTAEDLRRRLQEAGFEGADVRYLVRGRLASLLTRLGLANDYGKVYLLLSAILTPFVRLEELMTSKAYGYKLGAAARRRGVLTTSS
jgi:SAM-dependent methyltransferase